ncbi:hypothetical protein [Methylobacterium tarhaniae]|uniref:hypothetical protein n=1 Tax=Methylobacterium tarhaniae TaxID=1187852 RepID=UPI000A8371C6|nr:hypothetical protein [Methylobacterium tarhaniae]
MRRYVLAVSTIIVCSLIASEAHAQTSRQALRHDLFGHYDKIKSIMRAEIIGSLPSKKEKSYDLETCSTGTQMVNENTNDGLYLTLLDLSYDVLSPQMALSALGYPEYTWKREIEKYERLHLERIANRTAKGLPLDYSVDTDRNLQKKIVISAEDARKHNSALPRVYIEGGCGDGEVPVKISLNPPGGNIRLITDFSFKFCKLQDIDPYDVDLCNRWKSVEENKATELSGNYHYLVRWNDGSVRRDTISIVSGNKELFTITKH